jgi:hypothetical protein
MTLSLDELIPARLVLERHRTAVVVRFDFGSSLNDQTLNPKGN